jgi:hypothetical protein
MVDLVRSRRRSAMAGIVNTRLRAAVAEGFA